MKRNLSLALALGVLLTAMVTSGVPPAHAQNGANVGQVLTGLINVNVGAVQVNIGDITLNDLVDVTNVLNDNDIRILNNVLNHNEIAKNISLILTNLFVSVGLIDVGDVVVGVLGGQFVILYA